ncbi:GRF1-interacting factor 2 [Brassica napus]|uniref:GRF1-interacting factor 2 n=1 Tax=Brassica napus TaxID=3708 RepID=UPI0020786AE1|nr:GRF1-interacting factor 2 [Brassica napus]
MQQMFPAMVPSIPSSNITTEQIQKYLDENKKLIMAIMENQNLGKLAECAQYQALLQKNLMYLAAIADAQPPPPTTGPAPAPAPAPAMASQMTAPHPSMQPPSYFMQHPQASGMVQQQASPAGIFPPQRGPLQFGNPHQLQDQHQQLQLHHQQAMQGGHMGIRPMGINNNNGMQQHQMQQLPETSLGGSVGLRVGKQDGAEGQGKDNDGK